MAREFEDFHIQVDDKKQDLSDKFRGVIVACSGGPDSTALFHLFWAASNSGKNFSVALGHVAYGLRGGESEADFDFCAALAKAHGASFFSRNAGTAPKSGVQEWARDLRRDFFAGLAADGWVIALAHHLDDVAETALFRLARGASIGKLAGMKAWDPPYWRPLLQTRKAALLAYLARENKPYRVDSSNARDVYARNVIRNKVLPELEALFPGAAGRIAATALEGQALVSPENADAAAASRVSSGTWLAARLPRGTQLSRRMLQSLPGGACLVAPAGVVAKAPRESQHRLGLKAFEASVLLEPGSHATLTRGKRQWRFMAPPLDPLIPAKNLPSELSAHGIGARTPLVFAATSPHTVSPPGNRKTWTLKDLSRRWSIRHDAREDYLAIEYNQELIGLYDGAAVVRPSDDGTKRQLDLEIFETTRERPHG